MQIQADVDIKEFIYTLEKQTIHKVLKTIDLLEEAGFNLRMPYSRSMGDGLFELRVKGRQEVRLSYCFYHNTIFILSGFVKKTQQTPQAELLKARNRYKALMS